MLYKISDLISEKISGEWGTEGDSETGIKVIRTANFTNEGKINFENIIYRNIEKEKIVSKKLKYGDIIIEKSGGSPNQPVGRVVFFKLKNNEVFLCNNFTTILRPNNKYVYPEYLFYILHGNYKRGKTLKYQNKTTGIINLKLDDYLKSKLKINSNITEQIKIAKILSEVEELITQRKESITLLDELVKSTFYKMFGELFRNEKDWIKDKLNNYFIQEPQNGIYKPSSDYGSGTKILRIDSFYDGKVYGIEKLKRVRVSEDELIKYSLNKNDIVINRVNSREYLGKCGLIPEIIEPVIFESNMMRFSVNEQKLNTKYLVKLLSSDFIKKQIATSAKDAVNQSSINQNDVKNFFILIPPIELQNQFAEIVEEIEEIKSHYQQSLKELENLFGVLSQKAFKGELDLRKMKIEANDNYLKKDSEQARMTLENESDNLNKDSKQIELTFEEDSENFETNEFGIIKYPETDIRSKFHQSLPLKYTEDGIIDYSAYNPDIKFKYDNLSFEYLHGIIMQDQLNGKFTFRELEDKLKSLGKEKLLTKEELQEIIVKMLENEPPLLEQIYDYSESEKKKPINEQEKQVMFKVLS